MNRWRKISSHGFPSPRNRNRQRGPRRFGSVRYIACDNPAAAERFGLALLEKLKLLREHPLLGRVVPERGEPNLREIVHHPYRIVYRVREREQVVEVLRFWHGAHGKPELGK